MNSETAKDPTLLVVDDDPAVLVLVDRLATSMGFTVVRETNGRDALAALPALRPDGAMVDVGLIDIDGFTLLREIKAADPQSQVILMTGTATIIAAVAALAAGLQWAGSDARLDRFTTDSQSLAMRLSIWRMSAGIVQAFPLLGTGLNTFGAATIVYQTSGDMHYNEAHNDYVQLLVEGGLVTFLLVVVAIVGVTRAGRARLAANEDGTEARWLRIGASTGLVAIGLQALVEFSLQMPGNAVLFVVLLALALYVPAAYRPASR